MEKLKKSFKKLDIFSKDIELKINGSSAFKSYLGVICTGVYIAILIAVAVTQIQDFFDTTQPISVTDSFSTSFYPQVNLTENYLNPIFLPFSNEVDLIPVEELNQYFTVLYQKIIWVSTLDEKGDPTIEKRIETFPAVPCKDYTEEEKKVFSYMDQNTPFYQSILDNGVCAKPNSSLTVEGKGTDDYYTLFALRILPCSLASGCKTYDEIVKANFQILLPLVSYNASNQKRPFSTALQADDIYYVHPLVRQSYAGKIRQLKVTDLVGVLPSWTARANVSDISGVTVTTQFRKNVSQCTAAAVAIPDNQDCLPYYEYVLQSSGIVTINKRSYQTLTETLGNIGGTTQVIFAVLAILYGPINEQRRKVFMLKKLYPLLSENKHGLELPSEPNEPETNQRNGGPLDTETMPVTGQSLRSPIADNSVLNRLSKISTLFKNKVRKEADKSKSDIQAKGTDDKKSFLSNLMCCCCKKKSPERLEYEAKVKDAHKRIDTSLDALYIVRYFNLVTVMSNILFDKTHQDLAPYVGLDIWRAETKDPHSLVADQDADEDAEFSKNSPLKLKKSKTHLP